MPVFRIEKNRNYTVMSNYHLRDINLSLKAKGLLCFILSLPEDWDYTLKGLSLICKDGIDSIRATIRELEKIGYVKRYRNRNEKGQLTDTEYVIYEYPQSVVPHTEKPKLENPTLEKPMLDNPILENPMLGKPTLENPTQINKDKTNTKKSNTDDIKYLSTNQSAGGSLTDQTGLMDRYRKNTELIKSNIEYDTLILNHDKAVIDEVVAVMTEVLTIDTPYYTIEKKQYPTELVRQRFLEINYEKLEAFLLDFSRRNEKIHNIKAYLITSLFNIPATADTSLANMVRHDLYGKRE